MGYCRRFTFRLGMELDLSGTDTAPAAPPPRRRMDAIRAAVCRYRGAGGRFDCLPVGARLDAAPAAAPPLPIVVAGIVFNVPPAAIRIPLQRRARRQERIDLAYHWPELEPPRAPCRRQNALNRLIHAISMRRRSPTPEASWSRRLPMARHIGARTSFMMRPRPIVSWFVAAAR